MPANTFSRVIEKKTNISCVCIHDEATARLHPSFHSDILSPLFCCGLSAACSATKNLSQKCQCASQHITSQSLLEDGFRDGTYDKMDPGGVYIFREKKVFLNLSCTQSELLTSCLNRLARHSCCNSSSAVFDWSFGAQQTCCTTDGALT